MRPLQSRYGECFAEGGYASKWHYFLAYNDVDVNGHAKRDVTAAISAIERESAKLGLGLLNVHLRKLKENSNACTCFNCYDENEYFIKL